MLGLQRKRGSGPGATDWTGNDPADSEHVLRLPRTGREVQLQGPLQELQWTQSRKQEEDSEVHIDKGRRTRPFCILMKYSLDAY